MPKAAYHRELAQFCRKLLKEGARSASPELLEQLEKWAVECDESADLSLRTPGGEALEQARRYRERAAEYRAVADQLRDPTATATYRHLAQTYDAMARRLEEPSRQSNGQEAG
jgi:dienelactone hydrolase